MRSGRTSRALRAAAAATGLVASACFLTIDDSRLTAKRADAGSDAGVDGAAADGGAPLVPFMIGYGGGANASSVIAAFDGAFGRPVDVFSDTLTVDGFQFGPVRASNGRALGKILEIELLSESFDSDQSLTDLQKAASGAYDAAYTRMVESMASFGDPPVSARIGAEMNGNWRPWSAFDGGTHNATAAAFVATFKRFAQMVRKRSPTTLIEWSPTMPPSGGWPGTHTTPLDYWVGAYDPASNPGGADVVSLSFYEAGAGSDFDADVRGGPWGLDWLAGFAAANGVKIALSDIASGVSGAPGAAAGGGCPCSNDAAWMQKLLDWIAARPAGSLTHVVFSPWAMADDLAAPGNRDVLGVWTRAWGASRFAGTWWKGPPVPSQQ